MRIWLSIYLKETPASFSQDAFRALSHDSKTSYLSFRLSCGPEGFPGRIKL